MFSVRPFLDSEWLNFDCKIKIRLAGPTMAKIHFIALESSIVL